MAKGSGKITVRVPLSQFAIENQLSYGQVYTLALRGDLGPVVREGTRIFIVRDEPAPRSTPSAP